MKYDSSSKIKLELSPSI